MNSRSLIRLLLLHATHSGFCADFIFCTSKNTQKQKTESIREEMVQFFTKCPRSWFDFENFARSGPKSGSVFTFSSCSNPTVVVVLHCSGCFVNYNLFFSSLLAGFGAKMFLLLSNSGWWFSLLFSSRFCRRLFLILFLHMASQGRRERRFYLMLIFCI